MRSAFLFLTGLCVCACTAPDEEGPAELDPAPWYLPMPVSELLDREPKPSDVVYLNREGATLYGSARDEASENESSILSNLELSSVDIPAFRGSARRWDAIVSCLRRHFEPYEIQIVENRPIRPGYMMAMMGGRPSVLGSAAEQHGHAHVLGLAPFNGEPIENAVVLIFTRQLRERERQTCETAAMEIAHAFGLDHTYECHDLMTYRRRCGRRRFVDEDMPCGEHESRVCVGPTETQNSHARLLEVLGPSEAEDPSLVE